VGQVGWPALNRPAAQDPQEFFLRQPMLRRLFPIHQKHRDLETISGLEVDVRRDIRLLDLKGKPAGHARDRRLHLVTKMTPRTGINRDADHQTPSLAAPTGPTSPTGPTCPTYPTCPI
jgi:hypothetical protein